MKNVKFTVLFLVLFVFFAVSAQESDQDQEVSDQDTADVETPDQENPDEEPVVPEDNKGKMIGGDPAMSWEDGGQDFFVMFNSNVDDQKIFANEINEPSDCLEKEGDKCIKVKNPQGDTCVETSSFVLDKFHIPEDAIIEKAYLIWMGAVEPDKLNEPTDNKVHLAFTQTADKNVEYAADILAGEEGKGKKLTDAPSFDFEGIRFKNSVTLGCSETSPGTSDPDFEIGYFTYRVDVTDFFNQIYEINKAAEHQEGSGEYYGTYTFSDLACTDHDAYKCNTTMVSAWSLFFIYRSKNIRPKKIYFYNGLAFVYGQKSTAEVSGFELPLNPAVRLTTMIAEGDPSLTKNTLPDEQITLTGQNGGNPYKLRNKCNDYSSVGGVSHIEVYNSVSSIISWDPEADGDDQIKCVSGPNDEGVNYGIDVDTFLLDSGKDVNLQEHLGKGDTSMNVELSVNQDAIFTNFMVLSVDIKGSNFDIPGEQEKYFCACPAAANNSVSDYYCPYINMNKEFYYLVKVQNWGEDETGKVTISDELDAQLEYVAGTTEYATKFNEKGDGTDWMEIPDKDGGLFPLSGNGVKLADTMKTCNKNSCPQKILVRYKVRPKNGTAKNYVFSNIAVLTDSNSDTPYKTNTSYPLKLKPGSCVPDAECSSPTPEMCGGVKDNRECGDDLPPCPNGYVCESGKCLDDPQSMCTDAAVELAFGKNTPQSENSIIIPRDNGGQPLVLGQFTLQASNCEDGKVFNFNDIRVHFDTRGDSKFEFSDFDLIYDADGNGVYDELVDSVVSDSFTKNTNYIYMSLKQTAKKYFGKSLNYFLIRAKINYKDESIPANTAFNFYIQTGAVMVSSAGTSQINDIELQFATFYLEPTGDYFIVTSGPHDPAVPPISEINNNIPVMQIKTKSIGQENSIKKLKIKVPSSSVEFGEKHGITGISLWIDTNNDGEGDVKIAEKTKFESGESTAITFEEKDFSQPLKYIADEEKYLVVKVDFNMVKSDPAMLGKISIPKGGITLGNSSVGIYELPLNSKPFVYECKDGDASCAEASKSKGGGCSTVDVESENTKMIVVVSLLSAAAMLGFALLRKKIF